MRGGGLSSESISKHDESGAASRPTVERVLPYALDLKIRGARRSPMRYRDIYERQCPHCENGTPRPFRRASDVTVTSRIAKPHPLSLFFTTRHTQGIVTL